MFKTETKDYLVIYLQLYQLFVNYEIIKSKPFILKQISITILESLS